MNLQERSKVQLSASITPKLKIYYSNLLVAAGQFILDFSLHKEFESGLCPSNNGTCVKYRIKAAPDTQITNCNRLLSLIPDSFSIGQ